MDVQAQIYQVPEVYFDKKKQEYRWITGSCFLEVSKWNGLLQEIKQFVVESHGSFKFFRVQFNFDNGPNIRFLTLVDTGSFEVELTKIRQRFTKFFKSLPEKDKSLPINSIFLPFPSSIIEFGLYYTAYQVEHTNLYVTDEEISYLLFDVFNEEELSETAIITAAFYLQVCLIKIYMEKSGSVMRGLNLVAGKYNVSGREQFSNALENNQSLLLEIVGDIMGQGKFHCDLEWINKWNAVCEKIFFFEENENTIRHRIVKNSIESIYKKILLMICDFLGLNSEMQQLLNHLVVSSLQNYYNKTS